MSRPTLALLILVPAAMLFALNASADDSGACMDRCDGTADDADGDGLDACVESCLGTSDDDVDSDGDGMPDNFEVTYGLDPRVDDAGENSDDDEFENLFEFLYNSDPTDPVSPYPSFYVAMDGDDIAGLGSADRPWRSIAHAFAQPAVTADGLVCVVLRTGVYSEDVVMPEHSILMGELDGDVTLIGTVTGAPDTTLKYLNITAAPGRAYMLDMNNAKMRVSHVTFNGTPERDMTGILMDGEDTGGSTIDACTFTSLGVGIDIGGAVPAVRRSTFGDIPAEFGDPPRPGAGIIIRDGYTGGFTAKSIGDETDPEDGWNDFLRTIEGFAVINERDEPVPMQANYWGTIDPAEFPTRVSGAAVVLPVLAQSSAVLASTIFCTVWDAADQKRIDSASVNLAISAFGDVTQNRDGTYAFAAVSEGEYTIAINAPGYETSRMNIILGGGEIKSVAVALTASTPVGSGAADDFAKGCALLNGAPAGGGQRAGGDVIVLGIVLAGMFARRPARNA